ncbi:MAG: hypothetical protein ABEH65_10870 [Halobacteriales archaeon]
MGDKSRRDPSAIETIAVTFEDLISALEFNKQQPKNAVLRVTPPFHGRMRARLHIEQSGEYEQLQSPDPIHIAPSDLLDTTAIPPYPNAEQTRAAVDEQTGGYAVDEHYSIHVETLEDWRRAVRDAVQESTAIRTPAGSMDVSIALLE